MLNIKLKKKHYTRVTIPFNQILISGLMNFESFFILNFAIFKLIQLK